MDVQNPNQLLKFELCFSVVQMITRVDGNSWALSAIDEFKVQKIVTPLNKDVIPITDSPIVVQQHMLPPKRFVLLSAQVSASFLNIGNHIIDIKLED